MQPATLHVEILSITGAASSVYVQLAEPPAEEGMWVEQAVTRLDEKSVHVQQGHKGVIRLRIEPSSPPTLLLRARRLPPRPSPPPPTPE